MESDIETVAVDIVVVALDIEGLEFDIGTVELDIATVGVDIVVGRIDIAAESGLAAIHEESSYCSEVHAGLGWPDIVACSAYRVADFDIRCWTEVPVRLVERSCCRPTDYFGTPGLQGRCYSESDLSCVGR